MKNSDHCSVPHQRIKKNFYKKSFILWLNRKVNLCSDKFSLFNCFDRWYDNDISKRHLTIAMKTQKDGKFHLSVVSFVLYSMTTSQNDISKWLLNTTSKNEFLIQLLKTMANFTFQLFHLSYIRWRHLKTTPQNDNSKPWCLKTMISQNDDISKRWYLKTMISQNIYIVKRHLKTMISHNSYTVKRHLKTMTARKHSKTTIS